MNPLNTQQVCRVANNARKLLKIEDPLVNIVEVYEFQLPRFNVIYDICTREEMGENEGLTYPTQGIIKIREDVYEGAVDGDGRHRFTLCHELGHLALQHSVPLARSTSRAHSWIQDSEWQADMFAAEFLMPEELVKSLCKDAQDIVYTFGVSWQAANIRYTRILEGGPVQ